MITEGAVDILKDLNSHMSKPKYTTFKAIALIYHRKRINRRLVLCKNNYFGRSSRKSYRPCRKSKRKITID